ncbi:MAG: DUF302 domain-containing protein [Hyphomicrobiaceae bacterium]
MRCFWRLAFFGRPSSIHRAAALLLAAASAVAPLQPVLASDAVKTRTIERPFADARTDLQTAIVNQGLTVDFNGHVGEMLKRTAADVGAGKTLYSNAEYFTFCSSRLSRKMMEADLANAGLCPYVMFVFEAADKPGHVTMGYRLLPAGEGPSQKPLADINALLEKILAEATE